MYLRSTVKYLLLPTYIFLFINCLLLPVYANAAILVGNHSASLQDLTYNITSPQSGSSFDSKDTIYFEISDITGLIKVEYYSNNVLIGTSDIAPFGFSWTDSRLGMQEITAHAFDDKNGKTVSEKILINVALNIPPTVNVTSPLANTVIQDGNSVNLEATAIDTDGTIAKVEFYADDDLIGEDVTSPYEFTWEQPAVGTYLIKVKATDNKNGSSFSSGGSLKVNGTPQVNISSPTSNDDFVPGSTISMLAAASDSDGQVTKVEFIVNGAKIGESLTTPFIIDWNKQEAGIYELMAIAIDENGGIGMSEAVKIYIKDPNAAAARLVSLTQDTSVAPQAIVPLQAVAENGYEVSKVEFIVNGVIEGEDTESPFEMNLKVGDEGTYEVKVKAYYQGNSIFESDITTVSVNKALSIEKGRVEAIGMQLYPNPVLDQVQVQFRLVKAQQVNLLLTDIAGNSLIKAITINGKVGENSQHLQLGSFPKGMYLLYVDIGDRRYVKKLIKR